MPLQESNLEIEHKISELIKQNDLKTANKLLKQHFAHLRMTVLKLQVEKLEVEKKQIEGQLQQVQLEVEKKQTERQLQQEQFKQLSATNARLKKKDTSQREEIREGLARQVRGTAATAGDAASQRKGIGR
jgi:hypothetical protein